MLEVLASQAGQLSIAANFVAGPSLPGQPERRLMIGTDRGYSRQVTLKARPGDAAPAGGGRQK